MCIGWLSHVLAMCLCALTGRGIHHCARKHAWKKRDKSQKSCQLVHFDRPGSYCSSPASRSASDGRAEALLLRRCCSKPTNYIGPVRVTAGQMCRIVILHPHGRLAHPYACCTTLVVLYTAPASYFNCSTYKGL
eukprot:888821-Amphidinium_carterae.1